MSRYRVLWMVGVLVVAGLSTAWGQEPRELSVHGDWGAYVMTQNGHRVCYMVAEPTTAAGKYSKRGDIFALITHRPAAGTRDVFSYEAGYVYQAGSQVTVKIGRQTFKLFTQKGMAWTVEAQTDRQLAQAIRQGGRMVVTGRSHRGTVTTDTFSLTGSAAAHDAISRACGVQPSGGS